MLHVDECRTLAIQGYRGNAGRRYSAAPVRRSAEVRVAARVRGSHRFGCCVRNVHLTIAPNRCRFPMSGHAGPKARTQGTSRRLQRPLWPIPILPALTRCEIKGSALPDDVSSLGGGIATRETSCPKNLHRGRPASKSRVAERTEVSMTHSVAQLSAHSLAHCSSGRPNALVVRPQLALNTAPSDLIPLSGELGLALVFERRRPSRHQVLGHRYRHHAFVRVVAQPSQDHLADERTHHCHHSVLRSPTIAEFRNICATANTKPCLRTSPS